MHIIFGTLDVDYNGKKIGYDLALSTAAGISAEIITPWRSVKVTWAYPELGDNIDQATIGLYWDSARDLSKRFVGTSRMEKTATNSYKWITTLSCPYLTQVSCYILS